MVLVFLCILCKLRIVQILQNLLRPFVGECREEVLESLAFDVKATLAALRKLRRQWIYQKKAKAEKGDSRAGLLQLTPTTLCCWRCLPF